MADVARLRGCVEPLRGSAQDLDGVLESIGDARYVLLGEATHGTHEFYLLRAELTKRLIAERGFTILALEADWPDAYRVNRYVRGERREADAQQALAGFRRFPQWMWRNDVTLAFVEWLREYNRQSDVQAGLYGIDLYSLHASIEAVLAYLDRTSPEAARSARERYACFDSFGFDPQRYGYTTGRGFLPSCEDPVIQQLVELNERRAELLASGGFRAEDELFVAQQNARVVRSAEQYYRVMYRGGISSWNLRDTHMADTVDALTAHFGVRDPSDSKVVVWAHNSHVGDARATELGGQGELNLGQLVRERHPGQTFTLGFTTYEGEVTAASSWDAEARRMRVRPALRLSHEGLFHGLGVPAFFLRMDRPELAEWFTDARLQRAIGVVYRPDTERVSHYYYTYLTRQFDAVIHVDHTSALAPLEGHGRTEHDELPETYPTGM